MSKDLVVVEELLDLVTLQNITRGCDIKEALKRVLQKNAVPIGNMVSIATDGSPFITSTKQGPIGLLNADTSFPDFLSVHCIIHREHLATKYFQYSHIM